VITLSQTLFGNKKEKMVGSEGTVRYIGPWGHLGPKANHITIYHLAPLQQKAFANFMKSFPNGIRRFSGNLFEMLPGIILFAGVMYWGKEENYRSKRKGGSESKH